MKYHSLIAGRFPVEAQNFTHVYEERVVYLLENSVLTRSPPPLFVNGLRRLVFGIVV